MQRNVHHPGTCLALQASSFESAQSLLALLEQRALCTFFSLPPQASLHCCGLMVSSPGPCASSGGCQKRFSWFSYWIPKVQKCVNLLRSFQSSNVQIFIFQFLSMSLFLNLLFEQDSYSNEYLLANFGVDTAENGPLKICQKLARS